jgi:cyclopropane-fatty-acyl-phospholipid synthase
MSTRTERWLERGLVPDWLIRRGIRRLLRRRLRDERADDPEHSAARLMDWLAACHKAPIAIDTQSANDQHYEVPAAFYARVLGAHRKYSSGLWTTAKTLDDAEAAMLDLTCERAQIQDGMRVLDLGCGWGSATLWIARRFPSCRVTGVSNSASQRVDILARAHADGLTNIEIVTADANHFAPTFAAGERRFDRIVSVEMMEHTRNWPRLFERCADWLTPQGRMFVHVFTHRTVGYPFVAAADDDWMAKHFFTGGQMPADAQMLYFQDHLAIEQHWRVSGTHYARTAEAWLGNFDRARQDLEPVLREAYGERAQARKNTRQRLPIACAELWGFANGREWFVSHYRLRPRPKTGSSR